jgi:hypothetical protein
MSRLSEIGFFLFANTVGFLNAPVFSTIGVATGIISSDDPGYDPARIQAFVSGIIITWLVCAVFSVGYFFFKGKVRYGFLLAPIILPAAYGLRVLLLL